MSAADLLFERELDLPPVVVFDAFIDPDLVVGWLARASIEPVPGGRYDLEWLGTVAPSATAGIIVDLDAPTTLAIQTDDRGLIEFRLEAVDGGLRGSGTVLRLRVRLEMELAFSGPQRRDWETRLDRLEQLLHGHPVDWGRLALADAAGRRADDDRSRDTQR